MMKTKRAFGTKLYSMFIGSILIPALIVLVCFGAYSNYTINEREEQNIRNILNSVSKNLEMQISDLKNIENAFYVYSEVFKEAEALNNPKLYENYGELGRQQMEDVYALTLTKLLHTSVQNIRAVVFFPVSGGDVAYYLGKDDADLRGIEYPSYEKEPWYQAAVERAGQPVFYKEHLPSYMRNKKLGNVYSYITAVCDMNSKKVIGVVKVDAESEQLSDSLSTIEQTDDNGLAILKDGEYFASSFWLRTPDKIEWKNDKKILWDDTVFYTETEKIKGTELELIYLDTRISLYQGFIPIIVFSIFILLAGMTLAFVNYRRQARRMVVDVEQITDALQQVEKGDLETFIELRDDSVFKRIADAVNVMTVHLKEYIEKEFLLEIQQQKAEYRALQSQINPHFLYNTLNGFIALNRMGEKKTLERSVIGLSRLFRYACGKQEAATVDEEIQFLEEYLKLEKLKYEERLEYMIWADEESRKQTIPKLLLQPIVENSIRHGMGDSGKTVMIRIMAESIELKEIGKVMVLTVRDNGVGFDCKHAEKGDKVGMDNVRARTELFCRSAVFRCDSSPGAGTKTTIVFPYEAGEGI